MSKRLDDNNSVPPPPSRSSSLARKPRKKGVKANRVVAEERLRFAMDLLTRVPAQRPYRLAGVIADRFAISRRAAMKYLLLARARVIAEHEAAIKSLSSGFVFVLGDLLEECRSANDLRSASRVLAEMGRFVALQQQMRQDQPDQKYSTIEFVVQGERWPPSGSQLAGAMPMIEAIAAEGEGGDVPSRVADAEVPRGD